MIDKKQFSMVNDFGTSGLDFNYGQMIDDCMEYGIPVLKKNGETYAVTTLLRKLKKAQEDGEQPGVQHGGQAAKTGMVATPVQTVEKSPRTGKTAKGSASKGKFARSILQDSLLQAYFAKKGIKRVTGTTTVPLGIVMAVYGNQRDVGESGLGKYLPNFLENEELKKYWKEKGIIQVTPQTEVPVKFIYLLGN